VEKKAYINILMDILEKKAEILDGLLDRTARQDVCLGSQLPDMDEFAILVDQKEELIEELNRLDTGFERIYDNVREDLDLNRNQYQKEIEKLQELIKSLLDKGMKLQVQEKKNKLKLELYFSKSKKEVRVFKQSNRSAASYYNNMNSESSGRSYFLDKKN
jgi:flagellar biosynthesis/type III secretory pathway chaperone